MPSTFTIADQPFPARERRPRDPEQETRRRRDLLRRKHERLAWTAWVNEEPCPTCERPAGLCCLTDSGAVAREPHANRVTARQEREQTA